MDLIDRQKVIDVLRDDAELLYRALDDLDIAGSCRDRYEYALHMVLGCIDDISALPTASAQSCGYWDAESGYCALHRPSVCKTGIIICKECKYNHPNHCSIWSKFGTINTSSDGYCYMAERRDNG